MKTHPHPNPPLSRQCEQLAAALGGDAPCGYKGEGIILCDRITRSNLAESPGMAGGLPDLIIGIFELAAGAGAHITKTPQDTFWGGYSGYFTDPDGYCWEIAWGPMFDFTTQGDLQFKT